MNKIIKSSALVFSTLLIGTTISQTGLAMKKVYADEAVVAGSSNGIDPDNPIINTGSGDDDTQLSSQQRQDVENIEEKFTNEAEANSQEFNDPNYANEIVSNTEVRGKAGLTAKAAAKVLKAGLKGWSQQDGKESIQ